MACSCASLVASTARHFDEGKVREELESYRSAGPGITTRGLLDLLGTVQGPKDTLLDIGSGIGALSLGLLAGGVRQATCVDLSSASLVGASEEAERQGLAGRIEWVQGDFVALAAKLPGADLVALDRVVCCYPAYAPLLGRAAAHSRHLLAMSFPRDRWWVRVGLWIENTWRWIRGNGFRAFLHSPEAMAELLAQHGFTRTRTASTWTWQVEVYTRSETA